MSIHGPVVRRAVWLLLAILFVVAPAGAAESQKIHAVRRERDSLETRPQSSVIDRGRTAAGQRSGAARIPRHRL